MKRRSGFTLIELLVVVSIIALLIAILLPSLARAKAQAQKSACASNMHQIGIGLATYAAEYDQNIPDETGRHYSDYAWDQNVTEFLYLRRGYTGVPPFAFQNGVTQNPHWRELILMDTGVTKDPRVFFCPAQTSGTWAYVRPTTSSTDPYAFLGLVSEHSGYSYQLHMGSNPDTTNNMVTGAARTNVDGKYVGAMYTKLTQMPRDNGLMCDKIYDSISIPHANNSGSNIMYPDAHVDFAQNSRVKTLINFPNPYGSKAYTVVYLWEQDAMSHK